MPNPLRLLGYALWIGKEIVSGTADVVGGLMSAGGFSAPMIVQLPLRCVTDVEITLMASSITITPGTLVVAAAASEGPEPPTLFVHALFGESEDEVLGGLYEMETRLLTAMRGRVPKPIGAPGAAEMGEGGGPSGEEEA